jgi:hypothetical protein
MAKRRTKIQIDADKIIKAKLNIIGEKAYEQAKARSRVDTGRLRDSVNYMVKPDTTLTLAQVFYGKFQDPNELIVAIRDNVPEGTNLIITEINDQLLAPFKKERK